MTSDHAPAGRVRPLDIAQQIGDRLVGQAEWAGGACTWTIQKNDFTQFPKRVTVPSRAGAGLYRGTAGIALFLGELHQLSPDASVRRTAEGAARYALAEMTMGSARFDLHNGRVGVAYVLARLSELLRAPTYLDDALRLLEPLVGKEPEDRGVDVLSGAAGAIPALLQVADLSRKEWVAQMAVNLGGALIDSARMEPVGWSWETVRMTVARRLCGYAHGAAGIAHALTELYQATGSDRYLYPVEQAIAYEQQFFDPARSNWPDLRHRALGEYAAAGRLDALRAAAAGGASFPYEPAYMSTWCHGAPGIALSRLRAYEVLGREEFRVQAEAAVATTQETLGSNENYSLCHGTSGNADVLVYASDVLCDASLRRSAESVLRDGWERFGKEGQPWPSGDLGGVEDPSLLIGEAGVGLFALRLHDDSVPSCLLLKAPQTGTLGHLVQGGGYDALRTRHIHAFFGCTSAVAEGLGTSLDGGHAVTGEDDAAGEIFGFAKTLDRWIRAQPEPVRELMEDAARPERARLEMAAAEDDFSQEWLRELCRPPLQEDGRAEPMALVPTFRLTHWDYDWEAWLDTPRDDRDNVPPSKPVPFLVHGSRGSYQVQRVGPLAAAVANAVRPQSTPGDILSRASESLGAGTSDPPGFARRVRAQLADLYDAGLVYQVGGPSRLST